MLQIIKDFILRKVVATGSLNNGDKRDITTIGGRSEAQQNKIAAQKQAFIEKQQAQTDFKDSTLETIKSYIDNHFSDLIEFFNTGTPKAIAQLSDSVKNYTYLDKELKDELLVKISEADEALGISIAKYESFIAEITSNYGYDGNAPNFEQTYDGNAPNFGQTFDENFLKPYNKDTINILKQITKIIELETSFNACKETHLKELKESESRTAVANKKSTEIIEYVHGESSSVAEVYQACGKDIAELPHITDQNILGFLKFIKCTRSLTEDEINSLDEEHSKNLIASCTQLFTKLKTFEANKKALDALSESLNVIKSNIGSNFEDFRNAKVALTQIDQTKDPISSINQTISILNDHKITHLAPLPETLADNNAKGYDLEPLIQLFNGCIQSINAYCETENKKEANSNEANAYFINLQELFPTIEELKLEYILQIVNHEISDGNPYYKLNSTISNEDFKNHQKNNKQAYLIFNKTHTAWLKSIQEKADAIYQNQRKLTQSYDTFQECKNNPETFISTFPNDENIKSIKCELLTAEDNTKFMTLQDEITQLRKKITDNTEALGNLNKQYREDTGINDLAGLKQAFETAKTALETGPYLKEDADKLNNNLDAINSRLHHSETLFNSINEYFDNLAKQINNLDLITIKTIDSILNDETVAPADVPYNLYQILNDQIIDNIQKELTEVQQTSIQKNSQQIISQLKSICESTNTAVDYLDTLDQIRNREGYNAHNSSFNELSNKITEANQLDIVMKLANIFPMKNKVVITHVCNSVIEQIYDKYIEIKNYFQDITAADNKCAQLINSLDSIKNKQPADLIDKYTPLCKMAYDDILLSLDSKYTEYKDLLSQESNEQLTDMLKGLTFKIQNHLTIQNEFITLVSELVKRIPTINEQEKVANLATHLKEQGLTNDSFNQLAVDKILRLDSLIDELNKSEETARTSKSFFSSTSTITNPQNTKFSKYFATKDVRSNIKTLENSLQPIKDKLNQLIQEEKQLQIFLTSIENNDKTLQEYQFSDPSTLEKINSLDQDDSTPLVTLNNILRIIDDKHADISQPHNVSMTAKVTNQIQLAVTNFNLKVNDELRELHQKQQEEKNTKIFKQVIQILDNKTDINKLSKLEEYSKTIDRDNLYSIDPTINIFDEAHINQDHKSAFYTAIDAINTRINDAKKKTAEKEKLSSLLQRLNDLEIPDAVNCEKFKQQYLSLFTDPTTPNYEEFKSLLNFLTVNEESVPTINDYNLVKSDLTEAIRTMVKNIDDKIIQKIQNHSESCKEAIINKIMTTQSIGDDISGILWWRDKISTGINQNKPLLKAENIITDDDLNFLTDTELTNFALQLVKRKLGFEDSEDDINKLITNKLERLKAEFHTEITKISTNFEKNYLKDINDLNKLYSYYSAISKIIDSSEEDSEEDQIIVDFLNSLAEPIKNLKDIESEQLTPILSNLLGRINEKLETVTSEKLKNLKNEFIRKLTTKNYDSLEPTIDHPLNHLLNENLMGKNRLSEKELEIIKEFHTLEESASSGEISQKIKKIKDLKKAEKLELEKTYHETLEELGNVKTEINKFNNNNKKTIISKYNIFNENIKGFNEYLSNIENEDGINITKKDAFKSELNELKDILKERIKEFFINSLINYFEEFDDINQQQGLLSLLSDCFPNFHLICNFVNEKMNFSKLQKEREDIMNSALDNLSTELKDNNMVQVQVKQINDSISEDDTSSSTLSQNCKDFIGLNALISITKKLEQENLITYFDGIMRKSPLKDTILSRFSEIKSNFENLRIKYLTWNKNTGKFDSTKNIIHLEASINLLNAIQEYERIKQFDTIALENIFEKTGMTSQNQDITQFFRNQNHDRFITTAKKYFFRNIIVTIFPEAQDMLVYNDDTYRIICSIFKMIDIDINNDDVSEYLDSNLVIGFETHIENVNSAIHSYYDQILNDDKSPYVSRENSPYGEKKSPMLQRWELGHPTPSPYLDQTDQLDTSGFLRANFYEHSGSVDLSNSSLVKSTQSISPIKRNEREDDGSENGSVPDLELVDNGTQEPAQIHGSSSSSDSSDEDERPTNCKSS